MRALPLMVLLLAGCGSRPAPPGELSVAAAANLTDVFAAIGQQFEKQTGIRVVYSFGATGQLARQIEHGAPYDVFAGADVAHVEQVDRAGYLTPGTRAVYARGRLAMWSPGGVVRRIEDLRDPAVRFIAVANPQLAPYGEATVEALRRLGLWDAVLPKIVYAESIVMAKQFAASRNADVCFTAWSLVFRDPGHAVLVDDKLHEPIKQALGIVRRSPRQDRARRFVDYIRKGGGRAMLRNSGYEVP